MSAALGLKAKPIATEPADDDSDISALINRLTAEVNQIAVDKTKSIQQITNQMKMLALNALIESSRAGAQGAGFAVVAQEVRSVGQQVETIARELETQLTKRTGDLVSSIDRMSQRSRGERMMDLSLNAIELIDRNLYERTCDVRWWATDSAVVDCAATPAPASVSLCLAAARRHPRRLYRLSRPLALRPRRQRHRQRPRRPLSRRRPERRPHQMVSRGARPCAPATTMSPATSRTSRCSATPRSRPIAPASAPAARPTARRSACSPSISTGSRRRVRSCKACASAIATRPACCWSTSNFRVIAASDGQGILGERVSLSLNGQRSGFYQDHTGTLVAFHATPGYETYRGLGWYGVIVCGA